MNAEPSLARKGLDLLLSEYPADDVLEVDAQEDDEGAGPWLIVTLKEEGEFAIWKTTGHVFRLDENGGAGDDPILTP